MKYLFLLVITSVVLFSCEKEESVPANDIPSTITEYLNTHFPDNEIVRTIKDSEINDLSYEITLEGGFYLEFNKNGQVTDIEGTSKLPDSVIPVSILEHVATNYADNFITGWELDEGNQQIRLNNWIELEYTMEGVFLRIDD